MTAEATIDEVSQTQLHRFRLSRAGILNVWQYDDQQFSFADGRLLLRGANGAGKSKTLEMLLPFVLDGDKARMTASARHHTSLLWLMTDGYDGQARVGYLWVEFARSTAEGDEETFTCGVGIRASASARTATAWYFTTPRRIGDDLRLEDDAGPLSRPRLTDEIGPGGHVFEQAKAYKEHVGQALFGLQIDQYDEILRLLYWLRQPQVGEDIEPARLAGQLMQALPQLDDSAVRSAGDTFDELAAFGEQIDRRDSAARALTALSESYAAYARSSVAVRGSRVVEAQREQTRRRSDLRRHEAMLAGLVSEREQVELAASRTRNQIELDRGRIQLLQVSPEARSHQRLTDLASRARDVGKAAADAKRSAGRADDQLSGRSAVLGEEADELSQRLRLHRESTRAIDESLRRAGARAALAAHPAVVEPERVDAAAALRVVKALGVFAQDIEDAKRAVGRRQAAVLVLRQALDSVATARRDGQEEDRRANEAEERWDRSRAQHDAAECVVTETVDRLWSHLRSWAGENGVASFDLPEELTVTFLEELAAAVQTSAEPSLEEHRRGERSAAVAREQHEAQLNELARRSAAIEAEIDPAPPESALPRTPREGGASLWRLVDFTSGPSPDERARLEAALQSSGLLDAWVRPDGAVLEAEQRDVVLALGDAPTGSTLADVLQPAPAPDSGVTAEVVAGVLRRITLAEDSTTDSGGGASVSLDGSWSLGPLTGRASKERAQYVGATARAGERLRRLDEVRTAIESIEILRAAARRLEAQFARRITEIQDWLRKVPAGQPLLLAWATLDERIATTRRDKAALDAAQAAAQAVRSKVAQCREQADHLALQNDLEADVGAMNALAEQLRAIASSLTQHGNTVPDLSRDLSRWAKEHDMLTAEAEQVAQLRDEAARAREHADRVAAELAELQSAVGADVRQLQERLEVLTTDMAEAEEEAKSLVARLTELARGTGAAENSMSTAQERVEEHHRALVHVVRDMAALTDVPGLLESAFAHTGESPEMARLVTAGGLEIGDSLPKGLGELARSMTALADGAPGTDSNSVYKAWTEASSGPAADHEARVLTFGELVAVTGRDEGGEAPIRQLATRVTAAVDRDRKLLTERERERFEQHILGELGDAIRRRRLEAEELVEAMNRLLGGVTTSQGIRVRLDWRLREDVPTEAREAVRLLTQPVGSLLPEERTSLRDSLHRLIEVSRAEQPELSYTEHLGLALDYRCWFSFRIRYTRPETEGRWLDLHRRSPLSQGEQKVLCYLPLFAAAAAHFSSLAGAAPQAPRLVLLDDAFPKIDTRTHPLLFGLLVQLDLDFVITSERLWGDHETLPSLAIYEALRDPSQRGIAQYEFRWDGRILRAIS